MKCIRCGTLLSPFLLRQVHEQKDSEVYEVECPNAHCRCKNLISKQFYFLLKKDFYFVFNLLRVTYKG